MMAQYTNGTGGNGRTLRLALPSSGALHDPCMGFMRACGLPVSRANSRRYIAAVRSVPGITVMFQRGSDITMKVDDGTVDMGIVGKDQFLENRREDGDSRIVVDGLGFGRSSLVLAVPDSWADVTSIADLAEISMEFRGQGEDLRVATKYPRSDTAPPAGARRQLLPTNPVQRHAGSGARHGLRGHDCGHHGDGNDDAREPPEAD